MPSRFGAGRYGAGRGFARTCSPLAGLLRALLLPELADLGMGASSFEPSCFCQSSRRARVWRTYRGSRFVSAHQCRFGTRSSSQLAPNLDRHRKPWGNFRSQVRLSSADVAGPGRLCRRFVSSCSIDRTSSIKRGDNDTLRTHRCWCYFRHRACSRYRLGHDFRFRPRRRSRSPAPAHSGRPRHAEGAKLGLDHDPRLKR